MGFPLLDVMLLSATAYDQGGAQGNGLDGYHTSYFGRRKPAVQLELRLFPDDTLLNPDHSPRSRPAGQRISTCPNYTDTVPTGSGE